MADSDAHRALEDRLAVVDALLTLHDRWADVGEVVAQSRDRTDAIQALTSAPFSLTAVAAEHVLDFPLGRRTAQGREALVDERRQILDQIASL